MSKTAEETDAADDTLHTIHSASQVTGDSPANLRKLANLGRLRCIRAANGIRLFRQSDLQRRARERKERLG